ncbi:hypothetical protein K2173_000294 [Erythroxylum novogranatense]|uniref:DCD domain-containing protein n=1 Tax=Erythroxylum novogranatense TaxID=1862640 RepID=A0AAV8SWR8_9ROSI|nr:hypothetical protein K2173_000294 [Erythroxylum novogranatense]
MKHDREPNRCPGEVPEYGAIFMSSSSTKKECFKRQLLGLPMGQANFVKQVKEGMILFLFEYEKRKLHGVFRASSDGQINIVPRAFSSSGKKFPAQVKYTVMWDCRPLSEDEFRDAIRNNYFTQKKFYFGLSENQVRKLLLLFSSRKMNNEPFQRQSTKNIGRPIHYSDSKPKSDFDGFFGPMNGDKDRHDDGHDFRSFTFTRSPQDSIYSSRRLLDGDNLGSASLGKTDISDGHFGNPVGTFGRLTHRDPCATSGEISNEHGDAIEPRLTNVRNCDFMESRKADIRKYDIIETRLDGERNYDAIETKLASDTRNYDVIEPRFAAGTRNYVVIEDGDLRTYDVTEPRLAASTRNVDLIEPRLTVDTQNYAVIEARLAADKRNYDVIEARLGDVPNYCGQSESMFMKELINVRNYSEQSKSLSMKEVAEDLKFTMRYGTRTGVEKSVIESNSPMCSTKCTLVNDQLQQLAIVNHSVEPLSSNQNFPKTYEIAPITSALVKPRISDQFCPTTHDSAPVTGALPYEPSVPHINCGHSLTPGPYNPMDESPLENRVVPSFDNPFDNLSVPSQLGQINVTRYCSAPISFETYPDQSYKTSMPSSGPVSLGIVSRKSAKDEGLGHFSTSSNSLSSISLPHHEDMQSLNGAVSSYSFSSEASPSNLHYCKYPPSLQDKSDLRLFTGKQRETYAINDPRFKASQSIGAGFRENVSWGPNADDKTICAKSQKRKSVFSRICFPAQAHKKDNCVHNKIREHRNNSSVDEVMTLLHQSRTEWEIAGRSVFSMEMSDDDESSYQKEQVALNSKLSKVQLTKISQDVDLSGTLANKEKDVQITESVPFLDFKRRGKVRKNADNANAGDCLAGCNEALNVQQKRRKLIRPNFDKNELSADQMQYNQNVELPNNVCPNDCGAKRNDAIGSSNCIIEEKVESSVETFRDGDADEHCKETVRTSCLQSENPVDLVTECHRFSQHCESTVEPVQKNCSKEHEEKAETEITCCGDEIGGFDEGVGIVKKTCERTVLSTLTGLIPNSVDHNSESKEVSPEPEPEKQNNPSLSLESLPGQYKASVENVSHCSAEESSQGICEVTDRNVGLSTANVGQELPDEC